MAKIVAVTSCPTGIAHTFMAAEGVEVLTGLEELNVMGFSEVLPKVPYFLRLERRVLRLVSERSPVPSHVNGPDWHGSRDTDI